MVPVDGVGVGVGVGGIYRYGSITIFLPGIEESESGGRNLIYMRFMSMWLN